MVEVDDSFLTGWDLLKEELDAHNSPIITFSQAMDKMLDGGIHFKTMTEIYGGKGIGKTTLCIQLALNIQIPQCIGGSESECIFIDTENTFVLHRLNTMATKFAEHCEALYPPAETTVSASNSNNTNTTTKVSVDSLLKGIHYFNCRSTTELEELIQALDKYLKEHSKIRLIIIDSLAFLFYSTSSDFDTRTKLLHIFAQNLRRLMNIFNLAIVVTNSMTTRFGKDGQEYHIPFLGESWTFVPNRRIQLEWNGNCRTATLIKCSQTKMGTSQYRVISAGIRD